jgi:hypothetical protein
MKLNSCGLAVAAAAMLIASTASADLRRPGIAGASDHGPGLSTFTHVQRRPDVPGLQSTLRGYGQRTPAANDPAHVPSFDVAFPWLPAEMIDGVDGLGFDRFDPRTGRRTVFADAARRILQVGQAQ